MQRLLFNSHRINSLTRNYANEALSGNYYKLARVQRRTTNTLIISNGSANWTTTVSSLGHFCDTTLPKPVGVIRSPDKANVCSASLRRTRDIHSAATICKQITLLCTRPMEKLGGGVESRCSDSAAIDLSQNALGTAAMDSNDGDANQCRRVGDPKRASASCPADCSPGGELPRLSDAGSRDLAFEDKLGRPIFNPKKILILTKLTRLEFERRTNAHLTDDELSRALKERGSDYGRLLTKYRIHSTYVNAICEELKKQEIEYRLVQRWDYNDENIDWADVIFTAGGDGTFLLAASKINHRNKPVIGINTDPSGSEGYMCLLKKLPEHKFTEAFGRLLRGEFKWLWRQRIRVTLSGKHAFDDPIELHDQQLMFPEYRWAEHVREYEDVRTRVKGGQLRGCSSPSGTAARQPSARRTCSVATNERVLPYLALNEVFIGESLSSRVSYYELQIDDVDRVKQKSSGFTACTGTGSTSWYFNINKLTDKCVSDIITIINDELGLELPAKEASIVSRLCRRFNDQLIFSPSDLRMAFAVRDPVFNATYRATAQRGFAHRAVIKSRCFDAHLVIDGGLSYIFNDGAQATLEMLDQDALRTVVFR